MSETIKRYTDLFKQTCPPKDVEESLRDVWNEDAPAVRLIAQRYERAGLAEWDNRQVAELCHKLHCTIWTLCAHAGAFKPCLDAKREIVFLELDTSRIRRCWTKNHWPIFFTAHFERLKKFLAICTQPPTAPRPNA